MHEFQASRCGNQWYPRAHSQKTAHRTAVLFQPRQSKKASLSLVKFDSLQYLAGIYTFNRNGVNIREEWHWSHTRPRATSERKGIGHTQGRAQHPRGKALVTRKAARNIREERHWSHTRPRATSERKGIGHTQGRAQPPRGKALVTRKAALNACKGNQ
jgi:hypothetical protein